MMERHPYTGELIRVDTPDLDVFTPEQAAAIDAIVDARLDAFLRSPELLLAIGDAMAKAATNRTLGAWQ